jgi:phage replication-related protein YjqB (UPF0714/DUF867 family)
MTMIEDMEPTARIVHADRYASFTELFREHVRDRDYRIESLDRSATSDLLVMAPHGGGIEPGTTELARLVAEALGASFYSFLGLLPDPMENFRTLHITSTRYDEPEARALAGRHRAICSLHGCRELEQIVYVGGLLNDAMRSLVENFRSMGLDAPDIGTHRFPAVDPANICHGGSSGAGIQIELGRGIRDRILADEGFARTLAGAVADSLAGAGRDNILPTDILGGSFLSR